MPTLTLKLKNKKVGDYPLQAGFAVTIGRRNKNTLVIDDLAVSGHHAKIESVGDGFVLIDLQSKNGSFVNEQLVSSHWLRHGDVITIGEHSLVFSYRENEKMPHEDSEKLDRTIILDTNQYRSNLRKSNPTKSIINVAGFWDNSRVRTLGKETGTKMQTAPSAKRKEPVGALNFLAGGKGEIKLTKSYTTIGKHPTSDIVLTGLFMGQTAISIKKEPGGFHLCFVGGLIKPRVNGKIVKKWVPLKHEDIIVIGPAKLQFINGQPEI